MLERGKLGNLDFSFIAVIVVGLVLLFSFAQSNATAREEKALIASELSAAKIRLAQIENTSNSEQMESDLSSLKNQLTTLTAFFPAREDCAELPFVLLEIAEQNELVILSYSSTWTTETIADLDYPVFSSQLSLAGDPENLTAFLGDITGSVYDTLVIKSMVLSSSEETWNISLETALYAQPEIGGSAW